MSWMKKSVVISIFTVFCLNLCGAEVVPNQGKGLHVKVAEVLGVPTFVISNDPQGGYEPFMTPCFETYVPEYKYFKQFADAGTRLYSFNANASACDYGHSKQIWIEPNVWDYSGLDQRIEAVLKADPNAMIMPRVNLGTPRWWVEKYPDELEILDDGSTLYKQPNRNPTLPQGRGFPSIVSEKWREDTGMALQKLLDHIQKSPYADHIFGYFLAGLDTEEWYHWSSGSDQLMGYSKHMQAAFQKWVKAKYVDLKTLRRAWNSPDITFETVKVPSHQERYDLDQGTFRDPAQKMNVIDFYVFYNEIVPETIDYFAKITKQTVGGGKMVGAFYGYMYEFRGDPEYGHNALEKYNQSPYLDFIFVTASYENRRFATGGDYSRSPAYSVQLHHKLWYHDNDVCSFLAKKRWNITEDMADDGSLNNPVHHLKVLGYTDTAQKTIWMYRRAMGFSLCSGAFESFFDLHGGYYDDPELMREVKRLNRLAEVSARYDRTSNSEILVLSDEASCSYTTFRSEMLGTALLGTQHDLIKVGAPADHVLINDLDLLDTTRYKLVIFLNNYNMTDRQRELVDKKLKNNGRVLMWCYAPGYFNGAKRSVDMMKELTGLNIQLAKGDGFIAPRIKLQSAGKEILALQSQGERVIGPGNKQCDLMYIEPDQACQVLGVDPVSGKPVLAAKKMDGWISLYSVTASLPAEIYRQLAKSAGVHIYNDRDDTLYANSGYLTIHANGKGVRTIKFPWPTRIFNAVTEESMAANTDTLTYDFEDGETLMLRWKTRL
jgi:hypothetical protein